MCLHRSYVVTESCQVFSSNNSDHHTQIVQQHKLDSKLHPGIKEPVFVEYQPIGELFDLRGWKLVFDNATGDAPAWWTKKHQKEVDDRLEHEHHKYHALDSTYIFPGDLDLYHLRSLNREGSTIIATGSIRMSSIYSLPPNTTIIAKNGPVLLENLREAYRNCTVISSDEVRVRYPIRGLNVIDKRSRYASPYRRDDPFDAAYLSQMPLIMAPPTIKP